ncbi:MAG: radical SAM protein [Rhodocyclaceae bacterium]|nr:radical SAM protein [Rhodocyclaceae bacterium]
MTISTKLRLFEKALRNRLIGIEIAINRLLDRQFIPRDISTFNIEVSSICNLKCRFCAYEKKSSPRVNMSNELFAHVLGQAVDLGFSEFHLTPTTGDVFMDKRLFDKLDILERHPGVRSYHFFTNLTIPSKVQLLQLQRLRKLKRMTISVYGHDEASFTAITKTSTKIYQRLIANLQTILEHANRWPFSITIGFRSTFGVPEDDTSELMKLLSALKSKGISIHASHGIYNNWGGLIEQSDVTNLDMQILPAQGPIKFGACVKLFDAIQVMATGVVNACACRDANATLQIGNLREKPLQEIISPNNSEYMRIQ